MTNETPTASPEHMPAVSALLRMGNHVLNLLGELFGTAAHLRQTDRQDTAAQLEQLREDLEALGVRMTETLSPLALELARAWEQEGERESAERLRWNLADLWENLDVNPETHAHPVPADGVHLTPDGVTFTPHGDAFPPGDTFTAAPDGSAFTVRIQQEGTGRTYAAFTVPPHVLAQLEQLRPVTGGLGEAAALPFRLPLPLIVSAERDTSGGVLLRDAEGSAYRVNRDAGYALPSVHGGLRTVTAYHLEETGEPSAPLEVAEAFTGYLTFEALEQLEQLTPGRRADGEETPGTRNFLTLTARRLAWGKTPPLES